MNRRVIRVVLFAVIAAFLCKACIVKDVPPSGSKNKIKNENINSLTYPYPKNVTINGVDYLQSQLPIGKFGGELITSTIGQGPKTFNPFNSKDNISSAMSAIMYDGLLSTHPVTGEPVPKLAKAYEILPDGMTYIIKLRHGIKWSDGVPITADDVMYTYDEIVFKGLGNPSTMDAMKVDGKLPEIKKIDDYTVKFTTPQIFAPFLRQLSYPIVPKHYFKPYSDRGESVFNAFLNPDTPPNEIVSSGAFKLKEYVAAQRVVFERNPNYYKINLDNQKLPYLDKVVYMIVGDTNNEILKFEAKELDVIAIPGSSVARYKIKEPKSDYIIYNIGPNTGTLFLVRIL